jgi:hypothetical protein
MSSCYVRGTHREASLPTIGRVPDEPWAQVQGVLVTHDSRR